MSRPSTNKPTAGRAAEGIDPTDVAATLMYGEIVPVDMSGITIIE